MMERRQFVGCAGLASMTALAGSAVAQDSKAPAKGVKITVLKTTVQKDLESVRGGKINRCDRFEEGQEFVVEMPWYPPEGFCDWAWADIRTYIGLVHAGGMEQTVACCTDGFRPVFFKLERLS
jgi:uncharacterized repeat protein (TIGR04076 family)